jgi:hypothetical protein
MDEIEYELRKFINARFEDKYDLIIPIERKGMALLRAILGENDNPMWERIISSTALSRLDPDFFKNKKRILILDDSILKGNMMQIILDKLTGTFKVPRENIATAAFLVHEDYSKNQYPDFYYYGVLDEETYSKKRKALIKFLKNMGSLLLDTEHLEVDLEIRCEKTKLLDNLCHIGNILHISTAPMAVTVDEPKLLDEEALVNTLPKQSTILNTIRKCRIIEKKRPNEYAFIPIFFPSIPIDMIPDSCELSNESFAFCKGKRIKDAIDCFNCCSIYSGLSILKSVVRNLAILGDIIKVKRIPISHMSSLFPNLDIQNLKSVIEDNIKECLNQRIEMNNKKKYSEIKEEEIEKYVPSVMNEIFKTWEMKIDEYESNDVGVSYANVLKGLKNKATPEHISGALDHLIDQSIISPQTSKEVEDDHVERILRTFRPDGEYVKRLLSRYFCMYGYYA